MTFDRRGFGASDGRLRQHVDPVEHMNDIRNAATYLLSRDDVDPDRLAGVGVCAGGGFMLQAAAAERRFSVVAIIAAAPSTMRPVRDAVGHDGWVATQRDYAQERLADFEAGQVRTRQALAPSDAPEGTAAMHIDEAYNFYTQRRDEIAPRWINEMTRVSMDNMMIFDAVPFAALVHPTPLLIVHGTVDEPTPPAYAQEVYDRAEEPKKLVWIDTTNHVQLYDMEPYVTQACDELTEWLATHMDGASRP